MGILRTAIDGAVAEVVAQHPKYFTPRGLELARTVIVRKVMAALRDDGADKPTAEPAEATAAILRVTPESREGRGYTNLRFIAGAVAPYRFGDGNIVINAPANCEAVYALAEMPPIEAWLFLTERDQMGAWYELFGEMLRGIACRVISQERDGKTGILMPWPWPPSVTGKIYDGTEPTE
jgi:hypothetical protein